MNALKEILANANSTKFLQPKFYWIAFIIGMFAACLAAILMYFTALGLASLLNMDLNTPVSESNIFLAWTALWFLSLPICLYFAGVTVAWLSGLILIRIEWMKPEDLKNYAFKSRFPKEWYINSGTNSKE